MHLKKSILRKDPQALSDCQRGPLEKERKKRLRTSVVWGVISGFCLWWIWVLILSTPSVNQKLCVRDADGRQDLCERVCVCVRACVHVHVTEKSLNPSHAMSLAQPYLNSQGLLEVHLQVAFLLIPRKIFATRVLYFVLLFSASDLSSNLQELTWSWILLRQSFLQFSTFYLLLVKELVWNTQSYIA